MDLNLRDIRLESLAAVSACIRFWELPDVERKIRNHFVADYKWSSGNRSEWNKIQIIVRDRIASLKFCLPEKTAEKLQLLNGVIQEKIYFWYRYVMKELKLHPKYARKIYWDSKARIDEGKIYQEFWRNEPDFYFAKCAPFHFRVRSIVKVVKAEEFIQRNSGKPVDGCEKALKLLHEIFSFLQLEMTFTGKSSYNLTDSAKTLAQGLRSIASLGLNRVYKILASESILLEEADLRLSLAKDSLDIICDDTDSYDRTFIRCKKDMQIDIFLHVFIRLSPEEKVSFFLANKLLLVCAFTGVWPYQTIFLQIVSFVAEANLNALQEHCSELLQKIIQIKKSRDSQILYIYQKFDGIAFLKILELTGSDYKRRLIFNSNICKKLFASHSYNVLYFIINDPDLMNDRKKIIAKGDLLFRTYVKNLNLNEIDRCMAQLKLTDTEIKIIKTKVNPLGITALMADFVQRGLIKELDQLLSWLSYSESQRIHLKMGIDAFEIVTFIFQNGKYMQPKSWKRLKKNLDGFLTLIFDKKEDIINFKFKLDLTTVYSPLIKKICTSGTFDTDVITDILQWQLSSNKFEGIKFKIGSNEFFWKELSLLQRLCYDKTGKVQYSETVTHARFLKCFYESKAIISNQRKLFKIINFVKHICDYERFKQ